jgi:ribonuclease P protein component
MTARLRELRRLRKRSEFLRAARGNRAGRSGFSLQVVGSEHQVPGVGFTVSKKAGNSPQRNRIRRRLKAAVAACGDSFQSQHDYVLVGRTEALSMSFSTLVGDLNALIRRVHAPRPSRA